MLKKSKVLQQLHEIGVVAVLRGDEEVVMKTAAAVIEGGIKAIEVTMTVPNAHDVLRRMKEEFDDTVLIGMGTVLDSATSVQAIQAGADFIVCPHLELDIIQSCTKYQVPIIPGTFTITEIVSALKAGCDLVKLFPANLACPNQIKNIKGPIPQVNIMPTGGINETNIKDWIKAGAVAVGIGSDLVKAGGPEFNLDKIKAYSQLLVSKVKEARES